MSGLTTKNTKGAKGRMFSGFSFVPFVLSVVSLFPLLAFAGEIEHDAALYLSNNWLAPRSDSLLNPGNRLAQLPQQTQLLEARLNLSLEDGPLKIAARPMLRSSRMQGVGGTQRLDEAWLAQGSARVRLAPQWSAAVGREVVHWGPGQFRSPSNPFYFDNARSDPLRELTGVDMVRIAYTPDVRHSLQLLRVKQSAVAPTGWLLRAEQRGESWAIGAAAYDNGQTSPFYGAWGQSNVGDALLLYGELGSYRQAVALASPANAALPFSLRSPSPRRSVLLAGAAWTFESGENLGIELLHNGHGYRRAESAAYFDRAAASPAAAGMALGLMPPLLNRRYLQLYAQSNLMQEGGYWRLMATRNLDDGSWQLAGYGETTLNERLNLYLLASQPQGGNRQELSALYRASLTLGVKAVM